MLAAQNSNQKYKKRFKNATVPLPWPDKQFVTTVANTGQIRVLSPLSNHPQPLEKTLQSWVIVKRKSGRILAAENQHEGYKKPTSFPVGTAKS